MRRGPNTILTGITLRQYRDLLYELLFEDKHTVLALRVTIHQNEESIMLRRFDERGTFAPFRCCLFIIPHVVRASNTHLLTFPLLSICHFDNGARHPWKMWLVSRHAIRQQMTRTGILQTVGDWNDWDT